MDTVSQEVRSRMMSAIRGKDTSPERLVRSAAHSLGLRFRLHSPTLPGKPDLVFAKYRVVIFVHGCFWHRHACQFATTPKTRSDFWAKKFESNVSRDKRNAEALQGLGWRVIEIWECETRDSDLIKRKLRCIFGV